MRLLVKCICIVLLIGSSASCFKYSFTGAAIEAKTVSVDFFENLAPIVVPSLSQAFTESLKDKFVRESGLRFVDRDGELSFSGEITNYFVRPNSFQGNETAATNRLSISVSVVFVNQLNDEDNFRQIFTRYADYDANLDLSVVELDLIEEINEQLIDDIYNKAVVNW